MKSVYELTFQKRSLAPLLREKLFLIDEFQTFRNDIKSDLGCSVRELTNHVQFDSLEIEVEEILDQYYRKMELENPVDNPFFRLKVQKKISKHKNANGSDKTYWIGTNGLFTAFTTRNNIDPRPQKLFLILLFAKGVPIEEPEDLFIDDPAVTKLDLKKLDGYGIVFIKTRLAIRAAALHMKYLNFSTGFQVKLAYHKNDTLTGRAFLKSYPKKDSANYFELWFDLNSDAYGVSGRVHLENEMLEGDIFLNGVGQDNRYGLSSSVITYFRPEKSNEWSSIISGYHLLYKHSQPDTLTKRAEKLAELPTSTSCAAVFKYLEYTSPMEVRSFTPNDVTGYTNFLNKNVDNDKRDTDSDDIPNNVPARLPSDVYNKLKSYFDGKFYSFSRISNEKDKVSLSKWKFDANSKFENFDIERYNYHHKSVLKGHVYHMDSSFLYIILSDSRRHRFYTIDLRKEDRSAAVCSYRTMGSSVHNSEPLAFRELIVRINDSDYLELMDKYKSNNLTYSEFLSIPDDHRPIKPSRTRVRKEHYLVNHENKMFLADRGLATLTFPNDDELMLHYRRMLAAKEWNGDYFIYAPYIYGSKLPTSGDNRFVENLKMPPVKSLFRMTLSIDKLANCKLSICYLNEGQRVAYYYEGFAQVQSKTLKLSLNCPGRQQMQVLFNIWSDNHESSEVGSKYKIMNGTMLDTDILRNSAANLCFMIPSELILLDDFTKIKKPDSSVINMDDPKEGDSINEYLRAEKLLCGMKQFSWFTTFLQVYKDNPSIRRRFKKD